MDTKAALSGDVSQLRGAVIRRLLAWALFNVGLGALGLALRPGRLLQGLATQAVAWGAVNGAIALAGGWMERRRMARDGVAEARGLRRILLLNTGLDVLYVMAGTATVLLRGGNSLLWCGYGWGIVLQGAFLFFFDLLHAQLVPPDVPLQPLEAFRGPEHLPFLLKGGRPAALLVHGFPGTPAEMCDLGESLHRAGWTVQGLLLPGFGPELSTLAQRRYEDWLGSVEDALQQLHQGHEPLLLVGNSMGGALATAVAARGVVDGLILLAPFVWQDSPLQHFLGWLLRPFLPRYFQPFRLFNLSDAQARRFLANLMPQLNLDDPRVQEQLRQIRVPLSLFDQVRKAGQAALVSAPLVHVPTLVVVGKGDQLAGPARVRPLLGRMHPAPRYLEVDAAHDLTARQNGSWRILEAAVLEFAASVVPEIEAPSN